MGGNQWTYWHKFISGLCSLELGIWSVSDFREAKCYVDFKTVVMIVICPWLCLKSIYLISSVNIMQRWREGLCESGMCPGKLRRQGRDRILSLSHAPQPAAASNLAAAAVLGLGRGLGLRWGRRGPQLLHGSRGGARLLLKAVTRGLGFSAPREQ